MLNIDVAVISSLAATTTKTGHEFRRMALLGHEAESHYHSLDDLRLEDVDDEDAVAKMKKKVRRRDKRYSTQFCSDLKFGESKHRSSLSLHIKG